MELRDKIKSLSVISSDYYYGLISEYGREFTNSLFSDILKEKLSNFEFSFENSKMLWDKYGYYLAVSNDYFYVKKFIDSFSSKNNKRIIDEKKNGFYLLSKNYIKILNSDEISIDLDMVFGSIKTEKCKNMVIDKFNYLFSNCNRNLKFDSKLKECISNFKLGDVIYKGSNTLSEDELLDNVDMYVSYSIARNYFLINNTGLVKKMTDRYYASSLSSDDLFLEGYLGLFDAISRFDVRKRYRFSTYSTFYIKMKVESGICEKDNMIKYSSYLVKERNRIIRGFAELSRKLDRQPTNMELASYLKVTPNKIEHIRALFLGYEVNSLDKDIMDSEIHGLYEFVGDNNNSFVDDIIFGDAFRTLLEKIKRVLSDSEYEVVVNSIFLDKTLREIAKDSDCSFQYIGQIRKRALSKIRDIRGIKEFDIV